MKRVYLKKIFAVLCIVAGSFNNYSALASVDFSKIPDVLYEGSILTFSAKPKTILSNSGEDFSVSLITADDKEIPLETIVNPSNTKAQVVLPLLPSKSSGIFRITLKARSANSEEGVNRLLARKPSNVNVLLSSDKPISSLLNLSSALVLPEDSSDGLFTKIVGPQGATGATGATGVTGLSAYEVAIKNGFSGSESDWLNSLVGAQGAKGSQGETGPQGIQGLQGEKGESGPVGKDGAQGPQGASGATGAAGPQGLQGPMGPTGLQGVVGPAGAPGANGLSAYEIAVKNGFSGTELDWLLSLKGTDGSNGISPEVVQGPAGPQGLQGPAGPVGAQGPQGAIGPQGPQGPTGATGAQGPQGPIGATGTQGPQGPAGTPGLSAYQIALNNGFNGTESEWLLSLKNPNVNMNAININGLGANASVNVSGLNFIKITDSTPGSSDVLRYLTGATSGQRLTLLFDGTTRVLNTNAYLANEIDLAGNGSSAISFAIRTVVELIYDGSFWHETNRSVN